ncbi:DUF998 domain-containing protein [Nonomuraea sp. NPDC049758]|uniref:DUF998 domain-containing protein n=1 Tax=Nonomuraea sp. NPDC049758 TaxID=3154360 RepID=UPI00341F1FA8
MFKKIGLLCGVVAGPLFIFVLLVQGAVRDGYDPIHHAGSSLELGSSLGWIQQVNFILAGGLAIVFALAVPGALREHGRKSAWGPLLIALWGVGLIGAGVFLDDPVSGYPVGTPALTVPPTTHGDLHGKLSLVGFLALTVAHFVFARRFAGWGQRRRALYSVLSGILFPIGFVLFVSAFLQVNGLAEIGGLLQRLTVGIGWLWLTLLAVHLIRMPNGLQRARGERAARQ